MPPLTYSAKPISGTVVDADTGQPLEGVIVVAQWVLNLAPSGTVPRLKVLETVTDAKGSYEFPGWGPKANSRYPLTSLNFRAPDLNLYKPGYKPLFLMNEYESNESVRTSDWDGKTIRLERFRGKDDELVERLARLQSALSWGRRMEWRLLPRMSISLELERLRLDKSAGVRRGTNISGLYELGVTAEEVQKLLEAQK
jgi:hypothetical protein